MKKESFNDIVRRHFSYLVSDYGFSITEEFPVGENPVSRGMVIYVSNFKETSPEVKQILIRIILDRGYVLVDLGSSDMSNRDLFGLTEVMKVAAPELDINEKIDFSKDAYDIIELQVSKLANIVYRYCVPFLRGDFSIGERVIENRIKAREDRIKAWKHKTN